jgi:hypothetical protein
MKGVVYHRLWLSGCVETDVQKGRGLLQNGFAICNRWEPLGARGWQGMCDCGAVGDDCTGLKTPTRDPSPCQTFKVKTSKEHDHILL